MHKRRHAKQFQVHGNFADAYRISGIIELEHPSLDSRIKEWLTIISLSYETGDYGEDVASMLTGFDVGVSAMSTYLVYIIGKIFLA